jgi:hypothetical protein
LLKYVLFYGQKPLQLSYLFKELFLLILHYLIHINVNLDGRSWNVQIITIVTLIVFILPALSTITLIKDCDLFLPTYDSHILFRLLFMVIELFQALRVGN